MEKTLIVLAGPTAVGKTSMAISIAQALHTEIISADSRQFYREMKIGTAAPTQEELAKARHHFIGNLSIHDYYNVSIYEQEALIKISEIFENKDYVVVVGGSGMYLDALCNGIDQLPDADFELRNQIVNNYQIHGLPWLQAEVEHLDPEYFYSCDSNNPKRLQRALEVILATGKTYSSQRTKEKKARPFKILKFVLNADRTLLYNRIDQRVDVMVKDGLIDEARNLFPNRELNALNTVGYKELFASFDQQISLEQAIIDVKTHSRNYAKRQLTWFKRDPEYIWVSNFEQIINALI
jgi:tRNA dimethylallyltransferase